MKAPGAGQLMAQACLRAHLERSPGAALAAVEVESSDFAALTVAGLAVTLASEGSRVAVVDLAERHPLKALAGSMPAVKVITGPRNLLEVPTETAGEVDVVLTLATLDPSVGADHVARWATDAVVLVTAGRASSSRLRGVGEMLRLAGVTPQVVHPGQSRCQ